MELVSREKTSTGWSVTVHGVSGFRTLETKRIVDTRVQPWMIETKTINILVDCPKSLLPRELRSEQYGKESWILKCPVPAEADYVTARKIVMQTVDQLPEDCKVVHVADMFDVTVRGNYPIEREGMVYLPSCAWENPFLAFDAGVMYGKGHN